MSTTMPMDDATPNKIVNPGAELAAIRESHGYTREYVAGKLHLRVRIIELLEAGSFELLPGAVFVKGYFRAYAKLLGVSAEPYIAALDPDVVVERKVEKQVLWQNKRQQPLGSERLIRWVTALIVLIVIAGISVWWQKNNDGLPFFTAKKEQAVAPGSQQVENKVEVKITDVSKLQSLFRPAPQPEPMEKQGG